MKIQGFTYQPDSEGSCGVYAFMHASLLLGYTMTRKVAKELVHYVSAKDALLRLFNGKLSHDQLWEEIGTDEKGIIKGIKKLNIPFKECYFKTKKHFDRISKYPSIIFINYFYDETDNGHWAVYAGKYRGKYIIIDSAPWDNKSLISLYTWKELEKRIEWFIDDGMYLEGYAIVLKQCIKNIYPLIYKKPKVQKTWGAVLHEIKNSRKIKKANSNASLEKTIRRFYSLVAKDATP